MGETQISLFRLSSPSSEAKLSSRLKRAFLLLAVVGAIAGWGASSSSTGVPADIEAVLSQPRYGGATWGLRVVEVKSGKATIDLRSNDKFLIGSVRKIFSVGELLDEVGPNHTYDTPIYRQGTMDGSGVLKGDLILVASGDLTMGGRTNRDGTIAISNYDHNEADSLGNAVLTAPDPLAGYKAIAAQVAAAGITRITGEIIIDDRLFQPYRFRHEFDVRPIFVNDDVVDLSINPTMPGRPASVVSRPVSAAFGVQSSLRTTRPGTDSTLSLQPAPPTHPGCIGTPGCVGHIVGNLAADYKPPLTNAFPLVQTFRITQPSNYARTVLIEALQSERVTVDAAPVEQNPTQLLPSKNSYSAKTRVAQFTGMPYLSDANLILKVSYNIGADTSLLLYGLTQGVDNMTDALAAEQKILAAHYGIQPTEYSFVDGSGGGNTSATPIAVTDFLRDRTTRPTFQIFFDSLPILAVDGSLVFVTNFESDPTLADAKGKVHAKTGTFVEAGSTGLVLKSQALAGYVATKGGKQLVFEIVVNNVKINDLNDVLQAFQDEGKIAAILWRDN